jgi:predicted porin
MKKINALFYVGIFFGGCTNAFAQSSVTLFGTIDESLQYTHNDLPGTSQIKLQSGQLQLSNWGVKGTEDLGGGLKAVFRLQDNFDLNNGANVGAFFDEASYVGISSDRFGSVTVGLQHDALQDVVLDVQGNNYLYYFTAPGDVDDADGSAHQKNSIKWTSAPSASVKAVVVYSVGGVSGASGSGQAYSGALSYTIGQSMLAGGYYHIDNGNSHYSSRGATTASGLFNYSVNDAYSTASSINIARVGGRFTLDKLTVGAYYSFSEYASDASSTFKTNEIYQNGSLYAIWQFSPAIMVQTGYDYLRSHGDSSATYQQFTVAADYVLSKRTDAYVSAGYGHAAGSNGSGSAQAVISDSYAPAGGPSQVIAIVGIRHHF